MSTEQNHGTGSDWRLTGIRVVHADELDVNTPQTPGMNRAAAINAARAGAEGLWAGTVRDPSGGQDRRASPRSPGERHLRADRPRPDAVG